MAADADRSEDTRSGVRSSVWKGCWATGTRELVNGKN
jgi:hypothetical protein